MKKLLFAIMLVLAAPSAWAGATSPSPIEIDRGTGSGGAPGKPLTSTMAGHPNYSNVFVNMYTSPLVRARDANAAQFGGFSSGSGANYSYCDNTIGCGRDPRTGNFYDAQRADTLLYTSTKAGPTTEEFGLALGMGNVTGSAGQYANRATYPAGRYVQNQANSSVYRTQTTRSCTTAASGGAPTGYTTSTSGTCTFTYVGPSSGNAKVTLGVTHYAGAGGGNGWGSTIDFVEDTGHDPTAFTADMELDMVRYPIVDHAPGSAYGAGYGIYQGNAGPGIGAIAHALTASGPDTSLNPSQETITTTAGSTAATVSSPTNVWPLQAIYATTATANFPDGNSVASTDFAGNVTLTNPATATGTFPVRFISFGVHAGFELIDPKSAKDFGFANYSWAGVGFSNHSAHALYGFQDASVNPDGTAGAQNGMRLQGRYSIAALDTTAATLDSATAINLANDQFINFGPNMRLQYTAGARRFQLVYNGVTISYVDFKGNLIATTTKVSPVTVASLPTCNAAAEGTTSAVTDANAATYNSVAAGGGTNHMPVYCNGTNWTLH